jgi:ATP-binding cassette subfamily B (MDR/TAP) protein 1
MTLIFGNFVQSFLGFGASLAKAEAGDATSQAQIPAAAAAFRHSTAKDAAALVYIGEIMLHPHINRTISFFIPF